MQTYCVTLVAACAALVAACAAFVGLTPPVSAQGGAIVAAPAASTNSVEITANALRQLVIAVGNPDLSAADAIAAFTEATKQMDSAIMIARMDLDQARKDMAEYTRAGKDKEMDELMEKTSNQRLKELLDTDDEVGDAFVKFIQSLATFDKVLNGVIR